MITDDERRWQHTNPEIPKHSGKVHGVENFDLGYFGLTTHKSDLVAPLCRMIMEKVMESILDAGYNPDDLKGTKTGVFLSVCFIERPKT